MNEEKMSKASEKCGTLMYTNRHVKAAPEEQRRKGAEKYLKN